MENTKILNEEELEQVAGGQKTLSDDALENAS